MASSLVKSYLELYTRELERASTTDRYLAELEDIIDDLIRKHRLRIFSTEDVGYILAHLPEHHEKKGEWLNFGLESLSESVIKGNINIAFDGGDALAKKARERMEAIKLKGRKGT